MPRILKDLKITEVSSVDRGAGEGVRVLLMKRDETPSTGAVEMNPEEIKAAIAKAAADAAATATAAFVVELAKRDSQIAVLKMSPAHKAFYDNCDEATKKAFEGMDDEKRDAHMKANPFKKAADPVVTEDLAKRDADIAKVFAENAELRKRLDQADLEKAQADFTKRAAEMGLTQPGDGELMRKAYAGDAVSQKLFEARQQDVVKALSKQVETSKLFSEFGSQQITFGKAYDSLTALATEVRKGDPKLTPEQAFAKVYTDPANRELVAQHKQEAAPKLQ